MNMHKVKLKEVAKIGAGQSAPKELGYEIDGYPFIRAGSLENLLHGESITSLEKVSEEVARKHKLKLYWPETVIFAKSGMSATKNRVYMLESLSYVVSHLAVLEPFKVDPKYLVYALRHFSPTRLIKDNAYPSISLKSIENHTILMPEKEDDQIHIANLLSRVESLISKREESIQLLDELLKSTFLDMFEIFFIEKNDEYVLDDLCIDIVDCPHSTPKYSDKKTSYACLRTSEFSDGYISWNSMKYVDESEYLARVKRIIPKTDDVIYAREGSYGDAVRILEDNRFCLGQRTLLLRPNTEECNSEFLWALVRSPYVYKQAKKKNVGATVGRVNVKDIKSFKVIKPAKTLQDKFAIIVQQVEKTKAIYQSSLDELKELFGSLSNRAFKGELDFREMPLIERKEVKPIQDQARSGAEDFQVREKKENDLNEVDQKLKDEIRVVKKIDDSWIDSINLTTEYVDHSNNPVYSEEFLWMLIKQSNDNINFETLNSILEKFDFREHPSYDQIQKDIFSLIKKSRLKQIFDKEKQRIILSKRI